LRRGKDHKHLGGGTGTPKKKRGRDPRLGKNLSLRKKGGKSVFSKQETIDWGEREVITERRIHRGRKGGLPKDPRASNSHLRENGFTLSR